ncbi:MAG: Gfo/Idh/MocA family protein [Phycisphaerae bacterium]
MRIVLIGSYGHAGIVLNSVARRDDLELVAAAKWGPDDPMPFLQDPEMVPKGLKVYDDYRRMLEEIDADVAGVCMPLYRMAEASLEAVDRGLHVCSEKPLATNHEDLAALRRAVDEKSVRICAMLEMRTWPVFQATRQAVREGLIGRPILAFGQKSYPFNKRDDYYKKRETYGGSALWQAIHAVDFVHYCTGLDYRRVAAVESNQAHPTHPGMEDNGGAVFEFEGGGTAVISYDYLRPWPGDGNRTWGDDRLRIVGEKGSIEVVDDASRAILMTNGDTRELELPAHRDLFGDFVDSIASDSEGIVTTADSFRMTEVCLKMRDAGDAGAFMEL